MTGNRAVAIRLVGEVCVGGVPITDGDALPTWGRRRPLEARRSHCRTRQGRDTHATTVAVIYGRRPGRFFGRPNAGQRALWRDHEGARRSRALGSPLAAP